MVQGPGLFSEIGRRTKDLLTKEYLCDQKITITTTTESGLVFTSSGTKKGDFFVGDVTTQFKKNNVTYDVKVDTDSNIHSTVTANYEPQGLKTIFKITIPDQKSGKAELQYLDEYAGVTASIGLTSTPVVEVTTAVGHDGLSIGGEAVYDTASGNFLKYNAGVGFTKADFSAALLLADKGDTLKASYSHYLSSDTSTSVGAEVAHRFSTNENTFTIGGLHKLDPLTSLKARADNHGKVTALLQHEWRPKSLVTFSGEVDTKALDKSAKIGLALALRP